MVEITATDDGVQLYKAVLREVLERRPSGMRQRLAEALGKTRSFVSQITSPSYNTPIPPNCVETIMATCHFTDGERARFLSAYRRAHPRRLDRVDGVIGGAMRRIELTVPDLGSPKANEAFDRLVEATVDQLRRASELKGG